MIRRAVQALAVARLTTLVVDDAITEPLRKPIVAWSATEPETYPKWALSYLISCHKCVSVWAAAAILVAERNKYTSLLVDVLAGSQAALLVLTAVERAER